MNNHGQITGFAENGMVDPTCPPDKTNNRIQLPVLWDDGKAQALPTLIGDTDGEANAINDLGQAVGNTGTCGGATNHAVSWENGAASQLFDYGTFALAFGINNQGQIVGMVGSPDAPTFYAALWQNGAITNLRTLPGDFAAIASGINNHGQVVGSTLDSSFNWSHAFIWQDGVMTSLDTLFPASANLLPTMANQINERGQIVGMGTVLSGPHTGETHAFLATPLNASIGKSVADDVQGRPKSNVTTNGNQVLQRLRLGRSGQ
jgi:probable HAF family extracellular repeat protein